MTVLDSLENSIEVSHSSIQEIADSTESTAEAIQKQAVMCSNIQGNTDAAEAGIHQMIEAAHENGCYCKIRCTGRPGIKGTGTERGRSQQYHGTGHPEPDFKKSRMSRALSDPLLKFPTRQICLP